MWSGRFFRGIWKHFTHKILNHLSDRIQFPGLCPCCQPQKIENWGGRGDCRRLVHSPLSCPFHCLNTIEKLWYFFVVVFFFIQQCFEISRNWSSLLPTITHACSRICFFISTLSQRKFQKTKGGLFFHDNVWHGASPLITHTHLCDDERFCHPVQSSKLSFGSPLSYGISLAFFLNPPSSLCFFCS